MTQSTLCLLPFQQIIMMYLIFIILSTISNANFVSKLICSVSNSCANGTYSCPQGRDCFIECHGEKVCEGAYFTCPDNYSCTVDATGDSSMLHATINGGDRGDLILSCNSGSYDGCTFSNIYCPSYGDCNITSSGNREFENASFYSVSTTQILYIRTDPGSIEMLKYANIYCPESYNSGSSNCIVDIAGNGSELYQANIYALESFNDISLTCRYASDVAGECWSDGGDPYEGMPTMHCGPEAERSSCKMELKNGYDGWQCVDSQNSKCQDYTLPPTQYPTTYPTTNPSTDPTVEPTSYPTLEPTTYPTHHPLLDPTAIPTTIPTSDPTKKPTNLVTTTPNTNTNVGNVQSVQTATTTDNLVFIVEVTICIILGLIFIACIFLIYLKVYKNNRKDKNQQDIGPTAVEISSVATSPINIDTDNLVMTELPKVPSLPNMDGLTPPGLSEHDSLNVDVDDNDDDDMNNVDCNIELEETQSVLNEEMYDNPEGVGVKGGTLDGMNM